MSRTLSAAAVLVTALAFAEPNFTGTWKLDPDRSKFGDLPLPNKLVSKIEHKGSVLRVSTEQAGGMAPGKAEYRYDTSGKASVNKIRSNELRSVLRWDGETLHFSHDLEFQGTEKVEMRDEWRVSADGSELTQVRRVKTPGGEMETVTVLVKQ